VIKDWRRLASHFQALEVERHGEERAFVHVDQVARGHVACIKAAAMHRFRCPEAVEYKTMSRPHRSQ